MVAPSENSYATGSVIGDNVVGGLVGFKFTGAIRNSYSIGPVNWFWYLSAA